MLLDVRVRLGHREELQLERTLLPVAREQALVLTALPEEVLVEDVVVELVTRGERLRARRPPAVLRA